MFVLTFRRWSLLLCLVGAVLLLPIKGATAYTGVTSDSASTEAKVTSTAESVVPDYSQSNGAISVQIDDVTNEDGSVTADVGLENSRMVWYKVTVLPVGDVDFDPDGLLYDGENYYLTQVVG